MTVKDLIQELRAFDEDHHVVIQSEDKSCWNTGTEIVYVKFSGCCVIVTEDKE